MGLAAQRQAAAGVDLVEVPHTLSYRDRAAMETFVRHDLEDRLEYLLMD